MICTMVSSDPNEYGPLICSLENNDIPYTHGHDGDIHIVSYAVTGKTRIDVKKVKE